MDKISYYFQHYRARAIKFRRSKHFTFGIPFLVFVVGGSFVLKEFAKVRYEFTHVNPYELPVESRAGKGVKVDPDEEYKKIMSRIDIDNWENKRIPRPWEEVCIMEKVPDEVPQTPCVAHLSEKLFQCYSLSNIRKSIVASCHKAEEATIDDFKALLDDGEIFNVTELEGNNCDYNVLTDSILNSTIASNESQKENAVQTVNKPFVPFSVEEVSLVETLACWSNHNVRVIGRISPTLNSFTNIWLLSSIGEEGGPFTIKVDLKLLEVFPADNSPVQVFGEMQLLSDSSPVIIAKFFRELTSVDLFYFNKGLEEVKKFVPNFITRLSQ